MSIKFPKTLTHLIDFAPADYHIVSLDRELLPWNIQVERYHRPSRVGEIFIGVVRVVDKQIPSCLIDIGQENLVRLNFHHKNVKLPHLGERIIVQCKRDAYAEKSCLMSLMYTIKRRYIHLKVLPNRWFQDQPKDFINLEKFTHITKLTKILDQFAHNHLFCSKLPDHTIHWQFNDSILNLWEANNNSTDKTLYPLIIELESIKEQLFMLVNQHQKKEKGSLCPPLSAIDNLIYNLQLEDKIYALGSKEDLKFLQNKLLPYPDLKNLLQSDSRPDVDTLEIIDNVLSSSHDIGNNHSVKIEEINTLTALDVDSGTSSLDKKTTHKLNNTLLNINLQAIESIPRLLLSRNISGLIVIDPISTRNKSYTRRLVNTLRALMKQHHPLLSQRNYDVLGASPGGLIEVTRERLGASLFENIYGRTDKHKLQNPSQETEACNLLRKLYHQGIESPSRIPHLEPIEVSPQLLKLLKCELALATKKLEELWQGVKLWQE